MKASLANVENCTSNPVNTEKVQFVIQIQLNLKPVKQKEERDVYNAVNVNNIRRIRERA